jgi:hypothetical protein
MPIETYCLAHHVVVNGQSRRLMIASLRYPHTFAKVEDVWLFAERERPLPERCLKNRVQAV